MDNAHEIPKGSKLYFAKTAKLKREIERVASEIFYNEGFEEIVTPFFSLHQKDNIDEKELIRFSNVDNQQLSLRADSTIDAVRLINRRIEKTIKKKRWFYIQPVFRYPSEELYQIGGEFIGEPNIKLCIDSISKIFSNFNTSPLLFISNVKIPEIVAKLLNLPEDVFINGDFDKLFALNEEWLNKLIALQDVEKIDEVIEIAPKKLERELLRLKKLASSIKYENKVIEPLFYSKMRYYDSLYFSFIENNETLASGGIYTFEEQESAGFGIYTDALIETIMKTKLGEDDE
ncbi:MAG: ATP phosphoribosyltransferase regulatory subunit [Campylobacteraceae bacterium]